MGLFDMFWHEPDGNNTRSTRRSYTPAEMAEFITNHYPRRINVYELECIMYFVKAQFLVKEKRKIFTEPMMASKYGVKIVDIEERYHNYLSGKLLPLEDFFIGLHIEDEQIVARLLVYINSKLTNAYELRKAIMSQEPYIRASNRPNALFTDDDIVNFFTGNALKAEDDGKSEIYKKILKAENEIYAITQSIRAGEVKAAALKLTAKCVELLNYLDEHPDKDKKLARFAQQYLPLAKNLIEKYTRIIQYKFNNEETNQISKKIKEAILNTYEIANNLYEGMGEDVFMDTNADISVLNQLLSMEAPAREGELKSPVPEDALEANDTAEINCKHEEAEISHPKYAPLTKERKKLRINVKYPTDAPLTGYGDGDVCIDGIDGAVRIYVSTKQEWVEIPKELLNTIENLMNR